VARNFYGNPTIHLVAVGLILGTVAYLAVSFLTTPTDSGELEIFSVWT